MRAVVLPPYAWQAYKWPAGCWHYLSGAFDGGGRDENGVFSVWGCQRDVLRGRFGSSLTDKDILVLQLHHDVTHPEHMVATGVERLPDYFHTMALIREIGPGLRGVMVGNQTASEVSYRHMYGGWRGNAVANCAAIAEYILNVGGKLRDMGVTPWFAAMDWDILQDAYKGGRRILKALDAVGATNYVACGYGSVPGAYIKPNLPFIGDHLRWQVALAGGGWRLPEEGEEFPILRDYLQAGNFWCGLCGPTGIRAGNIATLSAYGYKGFITHILPDAVPELAEEFGDDWWDEHSPAGRELRETPEARVADAMVP